MQQTANYGLKKPDGTDVVDINNLNDNADIIDQKLKENANAIATKETPEGAQQKADTAETNAKSYADTEVSDIAGSGRTTETVKGNADALSEHLNDTTKHITSAERSAWNAKPSSQRAVSDSVSSTSSSVAASSKAVKTAYDKGVSAYNLASTKEAAFTKKNAFNKAFGTASGTVCQGNDNRLSNSRKCNNTFDNVSTARSNLGLTGTSNTTHYHDSRYVQTRIYNGKLQYYDGGWKDVGSQGFADVDIFQLMTGSTAYSTVCEVNNTKGVLQSISAKNSSSSSCKIKIVIDGVQIFDEVFCMSVDEGGVTAVLNRKFNNTLLIQASASRQDYDVSAIVSVGY